MPAQGPEKYLGRINEQYILDQEEFASGNEDFRAWKERIAAFKRVYRGEFIMTYANGDRKQVKPLIENLAKNALHDISGLANEAKSAVRFAPDKEESTADTRAKIKAAIADTHWEQGRGRRMERRLYMDLIGAGAACVAITKTKGNDYPTLTRLDPERIFPDVYNGKLQDLLFVEKMKLRTAIRRYEDKLPKNFIGADFDDECKIVEYYSDEEVVRAIIGARKLPQNQTKRQAFIVDRWEHKLGRVPVAFSQVDTFDGAFRGHLDQMENPMAARNEIVQYLTEYIESMVHAPFEARGILNRTTTPGPDTIYEHDETVDNSFMRRVPPAAPAGQVFGLLQYLEEQSSGEATQPPARQGQVQQSIASGTFVNSTLGRLTTVVEELQDLMSDLREQATYVCFEVDKRHLNFKKPLVHPVQRKNMYTPETDIGEYTYCKVEFGAMSGLSKLNADNRVSLHLGSRLISKRTARSQIDYLSDHNSEGDLIDMEDIAESFKQRMATDPAIPPGILAKVIMAQNKGKSLIEAIEEVAPELIALPSAAAAGQSPTEGAGPQAPGEMPPAQDGAIEAGQADLSDLFAPPPMQQQIIRNPI